MPTRRTKRGELRTELSGDCDVLICGASFAGLAVARELAGATRPDGSPARVLMLDRYEIGERQTSACGIPTAWLEALDLMGSLRQTFSELVFTTAGGTSRWPLPWTLSTFDYLELCTLLFGQSDCDFETAKVHGRSGETVHTDRGDLTAPLIVDALGWRRVLAPNGGHQPPDAPLSRGLEVHPSGESDDLAVWIDRRIVPAGGAWSFPAGDEVRIGVGSFDPRFHVKDSTVELAEKRGSEDVPARFEPAAADGFASGSTPRHSFQGNWIPHRLRPAVEDAVFFAGDSAGHCLPLTAEGIRTAFYFGIACGRELREVVAGARTRADALRRYGAFSDSHEWKFRGLLRAQRAVPRVWPPALHAIVHTMQNRRLTKWAFDHYLAITPPEFAGPAPTPRLRRGAVRERAVS
ncbi:MAG TPA: NAD(P)/FAD-dependent oxidoreductase [Solirubrobacteraceae bacterium]|nr:NAD(P)/FAD-dependent oxidoreductase [Solirubrobacteraceae bacterium]